VHPPRYSFCLRYVSVFQKESKFKIVINIFGSENLRVWRWNKDFWTLYEQAANMMIYRRLIQWSVNSLTSEAIILMLIIFWSLCIYPDQRFSQIQSYILFLSKRLLYSTSQKPIYTGENLDQIHLHDVGICIFTWLAGSSLCRPLRRDHANLQRYLSCTKFDPLF